MSRAAPVRAAVSIIHETPSAAPPVTSEVGRGLGGWQWATANEASWLAPADAAARLVAVSDSEVPRPAIEVRGLRKVYDDREVVRGVDLTVERGAILGLLGPNGAGKTTTVEILEGHRRRTAGEVKVLGHDPERGGAGFRERIGIVLQQGGVEPYLTVEEVIDATRGYYPRPLPTEELIATVGLEARARVRVRRLSGGQRRRLELALALCGDPELLFLDEPTLGFDPLARRSAWAAIRTLRERGTTVLLTTNSMEEADALADRLAIMVDGRIVASGTPSDLVGRRATGAVVRFPLPDGVAMPQSLTRYLATSRDGTMELRSSDPVLLLSELTSWALASGVRLEGLTVAPRSLEDVYLELIEEAREPEEPVER
ncbi:MAG: ABC transporter ATP-binding protein [Chloroflexi bacterium]|nr:ABC transporter ATP-binding protein [Chloroflexota bacterium]